MKTERPFSQELWDQTLAAVQDYLRALENRVAALEGIVQRWEATVPHVTERLQQDSRTSSRPPSSDPPQAIGRRPRHEPSGCRPGGQPGHEGHTRALVPSEPVDVVIPVRPDRWSAYAWYPSWRRQRCWAHLRHDIEAMIDCGGRSRELGEALRAQAGQMFHWGHRVRAGTLSHASVASDMRPVRREVERLLEAGRTCGRLNTEGSCREILTLRPALWTFVRHAGVEPTNHAAERAIRPGVLWRKSSFGTHRSEGSQCAEAMMTVVATLK